jgi:plasmid stabilization system protein ParE
VIREIDIWRVAVLMVNRYADAAESKADRCADDLETEGDLAGAAIWRRVTVAIERLTDTTGPPH